MSGRNQWPTNHPAARKHWTDELFKQAIRDTAGFRFMGKGSSNMITVVDDLKRGKGDVVKTHLRLKLSGAGVSNGQALEGNEEQIVVHQDEITIGLLRHAVIDDGEMGEQRVPWEFRPVARDALHDWFVERWDTWLFNQLCGNAAQTDGRYNGFNTPVAPTNVYLDATSSASIDSANTFRLAMVDYAVEVARNATYPVRPLRINGKSVYVLFMHDYQFTDLKREFSTGGFGDIYKQVLAGGEIAKNPIIAGADFIYNNVLIYQNSYLPTISGLGAAADTCKRAVLCGQQALGMAFGKGYTAGSFDWVEEKFDYQDNLGIAGKAMCGLKKLAYNGTEVGTVVIPTYAVAHT